MRSVSTLARWLNQVRRSLGTSSAQARRERAVRRLRAQESAVDPWQAEERILLSAPEIVLSVASATYTADSPPIILDPAVSVSDPNGDKITSAQIQILDYELGQDELSYKLNSNVVGSFDNTTGILTLTVNIPPLSIRMFFRR